MFTGICVRVLIWKINTQINLRIKPNSSWAWPTSSCLAHVRLTDTSFTQSFVHYCRWEWRIDRRTQIGKETLQRDTSNLHRSLLFDFMLPVTFCSVFSGFLHRSSRLQRFYHVNSFFSLPVKMDLMRSGRLNCTLLYESFKLATYIILGYLLFFILIC